MSRIRVPQRLYDALISIWLWYARKILGVPFIIAYNPPPERKLFAITHSWSLEYAQKIKDNWDIQIRYARLEEALKRANIKIEELTDPSTRPSRKIRRQLARKVSNGKANR